MTKYKSQFNTENQYIPFSHKMLRLLLCFFELSHCFHHESAAVTQQVGSHTADVVGYQPLPLPLDDVWLHPPFPVFINYNSVASAHADRTGENVIQRSK